MALRQQNYDVIVVGGGPAGSTFALHAARAGLAVILLEKDRDIGMPVRCGEASVMPVYGFFTNLGSAGFDPQSRESGWWHRTERKSSLICRIRDISSIEEFLITIWRKWLPKPGQTLSPKSTLMAY